MSEEPAMKKAKPNPEIPIKSESDLISNYINKIKNSKENLKAVVSDELLKSVPTTQVYIASITHKQHTSKVIQILNEKLPLKELSHLKRVRKSSIILCPFSAVNSQMEDVIESTVPELKDKLDCVAAINVPSQAPKSKKQYDEAMKLWSCGFHPDKYIERLLGNKFFSIDQLKLHRTYMAINFATVLWYLKLSTKDITQDLLHTVNASIVVDPSINSIVAVCYDNRLSHPAQHSAMIAIDNVAKTQEGGAWDTETTSTNVELSGINVELLEYLHNEFPDVKFGAKNYVSKQETVESGLKNSGPYLCTNYEVYLLREPCFMCSMGLTHARVKRVFFCFKNDKIGALKSKAKLHTVPSLNHHYEVFTGFL